MVGPANRASEKESWLVLDRAGWGGSLWIAFCRFEGGVFLLLKY